MRRHTGSPRPDWQARVESVGLTYHTHDSDPYWNESAWYEFTADEIDTLEHATNTLHALCLEAAEAIIDRNWWSRLAIPEAAIPAIRASWDRDDFSLYGRFDLAWDGRGEPKLLEYNADTPTSLVEASVVQWFWLQDRFPGADQFNSIHERLIEAWKRAPAGRVHFAATRLSTEDQQTVHYLRDTCAQAGRSTAELALEDIGWDPRKLRFVDRDGMAMNRVFKLHPWEWMWAEPFAKYLPRVPMLWLEPAWKMLLSNKGILPILWELFPGHPNLLPSFTRREPLGASYVQKPLLSREGANVRIVRNGEVVANAEGEYGEEGVIYQALASLGDHDGFHPVLGSWVVDHESAGMGIREDRGLVTGNRSQFVPHFFQPR